GPYSGGQSCQRHPVLSTWMMPLKIRRLFRGFWPGRFHWNAQSKTSSLAAANPEALFPGFLAELVETSGTTIHVLRRGAGRPLLLLHGYPETHVTWHKVAPQLAEQFSVFVPDLRGYGDSGKPRGGERHENYSFRAMAQDQVDTMRHYGHEHFLVAAH